MINLVIAVVGLALTIVGACWIFTSSPEKKLDGIGISLIGLAQIGFAIFLSLP